MPFLPKNSAFSNPSVPRFTWLALALIVFAFACDDEVAYDPESAAPTLCFEDDTDCTGTRPCRSDNECPVNYRCTDEGRCSDSPPEECIDLDDDGHGQNCAFGADCDDDDFFRNASVNEVCNNIDDNCDGFVDENEVCGDCEPMCEPGERACIDSSSYHICDTVNGCDIWFPPVQCRGGCFDGQCLETCDDSDGDGYGDGCDLGPDCDDRNPFAFPDNPEVCDGYDNNCINGIDEGDVCVFECPEPVCERGVSRCIGETGRELCTLDSNGCVGWTDAECGLDEVCEEGYCRSLNACTKDRDGDLFGIGCDMGFDCNEFDPDINPDASETCDGQDNDCDGELDEGFPECSASLCMTAPRRDQLEQHRTAYGYACPDREDRFITPALSGSQIIINGWQPIDTARMVFTLYRVEGGNFQMQERSSNSAQGVRFNVEIGGEYAIGVQASQGTSHPFALSWQAGSCMAEPWEVNNSPGTATPLLPNTTVPGGICGNDLDFYKLEGFGVGDIIDADITYGSTLLILEVWRDGEILTPDQSRGSSRRHTHFQAGESGEYYLVVRSLGPVSENYVLSVGSREAPDCADDALEQNQGRDNDAISNATPLRANTSNDAVLCPGDLDFYAIGNYNNGDSVNITIDFDAEAANLDAILFREDINGLFQIAVTDTSPETLPTNISTPGEYYVLVLGRTSLDAAPYQITQQ